MPDKPKLFTMVRCRAYMKQIKDTVHIELFEPDGSRFDGKFMRSYHGKAIAYKFDQEKNEDVEIADLSEFCGESVEKTYRQRVEDDFTGFVVGYTRINAKGIIGTDWADPPYTEEYGHCFKQITDRPKVAVVYFKNNCKRYVLLDDLESMDGEMTTPDVGEK